MADHPILFNGEMVRAILDGNKTQTRRVIKPQPWEVMPARAGEPDWPYKWVPDDPKKPHYGNGERMKCPYGVPGDLLWVRETFQPLLAEGIELDEYEKYDYETGKGYNINYVADGKIVEWIDGDDEISERCKPSIHMRKWACRLWLKVKSVRVERVQEISENDAILEGVKGGGVHPDFWTGAFRGLWDSINKVSGFGWDANPWVWVVEFERYDK